MAYFLSNVQVFTRNTYSVEDRNTYRVDTGASLSIISEDLYREKFKDIPMETTDAILKTYTGQVVPKVGQIDIEVQYGHQQERLRSGCSSL